MNAFRVMFIAILMLMGSAANALGLGELVLESELNQPLRARIPLLKTGDLTEGQIKVQLGSQKDFVARKMSRDSIYLGIQFTLDLNHPGGPCVILTTEAAIKEPSLDFLVELSWPSGTLIRGYTVLLEKPKG